MTRFKLVMAIAIFGGGSVFAQLAAAQGTYAPQSPTFSPWLGLWNNNTGALDNYHTFVRPQMELNRAMQMQDLAISRQAAGLQYLNSEVMQSQLPPGGMMPTGQGGTFMTYSHYYSPNQTPQSLAPRVPITRKTGGALSSAASASSPRGPGFSSPNFSGPSYQGPSLQR